MLFTLRAIFLPLCASALLYGASANDARAELYSFTVKFTSGSLSGNEYTGIFATSSSSAPNWFVPEDSTEFGGTAETLLSFAITVDGVNFHMSEEEYFPDLPRIRLSDSGVIDVIDYVGWSDGMHLGMLYGLGANSVHFGDEDEPMESDGDVIDVHSFSLPDSPDDPSVPPPDLKDERFAGLTVPQIRQQLAATFVYYGFRRPRARTAPLTSCIDWEWARIDRSGVHWCSTGCSCGASDPDPLSSTPVVYDFDSGRLRSLEDVQFDERRR